MSWTEDLRLRDLDDGEVLEVVCLTCRHTGRLTPVALMLQMEHRDMRFSEAAAQLICPKPGCKGQGARLNWDRPTPPNFLHHVE